MKSLNLPYELGGCKVRKNEVPSHAQMCDVLYVTLQRLCDKVLAYGSDEKRYSAHANFPNHANRSSQNIIELANNNRVCNKDPAGGKGSTRSTLSIRCTVKQT